MIFFYFLQLLFWFWSYEDAQQWINYAFFVYLHQNHHLWYGPTCTFVDLFRLISPVCSNMCLLHGSVFQGLFMLICHAASSHKDRFSAPQNGFIFSFYIFFLKNIYIYIIFFWLLTFGCSGLKKCADWLITIKHQWLCHVEDPHVLKRVLCWSSTHPVSRGSALITALNWSLNIDL